MGCLDLGREREHRAVVGEVDHVRGVARAGEGRRQCGQTVRVAIEEREPRTAAIELAGDLGTHATGRARDDTGSSAHVEPLHPRHHRPSTYFRGVSRFSPTRGATPAR